MHVISRRMLEEFWIEHADAKEALLAWYNVAKRASWSNLAEVRESYRSADLVDRWTVFNIRGNRYRLITVIRHNRQKIFIRHVLTHSEYDRGNWKRD